MRAASFKQVERASCAYELGAADCRAVSGEPFSVSGLRSIAIPKALDPDP